MMPVCRGQDEGPRPPLCVYLTTKIPSIRDKTTAVGAITPDLTLIKVIIVFFSSVVPNPRNPTNL